jgi:hypothetical protein
MVSIGNRRNAERVKSPHPKKGGIMERLRIVGDMLLYDGKIAGTLSPHLSSSSRGDLEDYLLNRHSVLESQIDILKTRIALFQDVHLHAVNLAALIQDAIHGK